MKHKIVGELIQEILEKMMALTMSSKLDDSYYLGRIQGLEDAIKILQSSNRKVKT